MSCSPDRVKDLALGELTAAERAGVEQHIAGCAGCREEWDRLQVTRAALSSLVEEDVPQRIAFVSDRVFEPKWWQKLWNSGPRLGFVSASLLAGAILVHAWTRPATVVAPNLAPVASVSPVNGPSQAEIDARVEALVGQRVQAVLAESEKRQAAETAKLIQAAERKYENDRRMDLVAMEEQVRTLRNAYSRVMVASNYQMSEGAK